MRLSHPARRSILYSIQYTGSVLIVLSLGNKVCLGSWWTVDDLVVGSINSINSVDWVRWISYLLDKNMQNMCTFSTHFLGQQISISPGGGGHAKFETLPWAWSHIGQTNTKGWRFRWLFLSSCGKVRYSNHLTS